MKYSFVVAPIAILILAGASALSAPQAGRKFQETIQDQSCNLDPALIAEIQSYQEIADRIIDTVLNGDFKGRAYDQLALFVDKFPNRLTGGQGLDDSMEFMMAKMRADGLQNVTSESVQVTHWVRGEEHAEVLEPIQKQLRILGLGPSVGTSEEGITAEIIVVHNFTELDEKKDLVPGKIVVYNQGWLGSYGPTVQYRGSGAVPASEYGAVAVLVESVTPYSLDTPHTGGTNYAEGVPKIPIASITKEDAEMLSRIYSRGETIRVHLTMLDEDLSPGTSRNIFAEIPGRELPNEIVAVSGHIDAWDVGQGAHDDGGGVVISAEALALIQYLGLQPRRTLQVIMWTAEEQGLEGVQGFVNQHRADMINYNAVFESDAGVFPPRGLDFAGSEEAGCIVNEILKLTASINTTQYARYESVGSDISFMVQEGVPGLELNSQNDNYFYYHHSPSDTMTTIEPIDMDMATALWAVSSYVLADLSVSLPRDVRTS